MPILEMLASLVGIVGSYLVYSGWKTHSTRLAASGWVSLLATLPLWIAAQGIEYGVIYALSLPAFFVWLGIYQEQKWQGQTKTIQKDKTDWRWNGRKVLNNVGLVLYMFPLLMIICGLISVSLVYLMPISDTNRVAIAIIAFPILWALFTYWYLVSANKQLPFAIQVIGATASGTYLFGLAA